MMGTRRVWGAASAVLMLAACGGGGGDGMAGPLVAWAKGAWQCDMTSVDGEMEGVTVDADIKVDKGNKGTFSFAIVFEGETFTESTGEWELDGTKLKVSANVVEDLSRYAISGVELDTDGIDIQEQAENTEPVGVDVKRDGDTVTFEWDHENTGEASLSCEKT